jgi:hypothetical protein
MKTAFTVVGAILALTLFLAALQRYGGQLYLATENANFEKIREKSKLQCDTMPLHCAVQGNDLQALRELLAKGADTSATDNWKKTALHWAAVHGNREAVAVLIYAEANPNARDQYGEPIIVGAVRAGHVDIVRALLDAGAPVNPVRPGPETPLHAAVATNNLEMVKLLLERGADIEAENATGQISLALAATYRYPGPSTSEAIVDALRKAAATRSEDGDSGQTKPKNES